MHTAAVNFLETKKNQLNILQFDQHLEIKIIVSLSSLEKLEQNFVT
jgi:hypothetical protein